MAQKWLRGPLELTDVKILTASGAYTVKNEAVVLKKFAGTLAITLRKPNVNPQGKTVAYDVLIVKDAQGDAGANNITVSPDGVTATTIDGAATYVLSANYAAVQFLWNGTEWNVVALQEGATGGSATFNNVTLTGLLTGSNVSGITAGTTRTQAGATALTKIINRVDTATAPAAGSMLGDGVILMAATAGLDDVTVINNTAFPVQLYANGTDTINGIAGSTGVALAPGDVAECDCAVAGDWRFEAGVGSAGQLPVDLSCETITAVNPVSQATAFSLPGVINHVTVVNAAGAAVALQPAKYGLSQAVENATANALTVYPVNGGTDTINGLAANTPVVIPGFTTVLFRAASAGTWQSDPFVNGAGALPSTAGVQPGSAITGVARSGGNVSVQVNSAGLGNGADTTDDVLFTYQLPASAFDIAVRQVTISAAGKFAANGNNKRIKIWWGTTTQTVGSAVAGGTLIADSGVVTTNAGGWEGSVQVTKYGAAGSNTQISSGAQIAAGVTHLGTSAPVLLTATENAAINITITGASPTTGAASDVLGQIFDVAFNN